MAAIGRPEDLRHMFDALVGRLHEMDAQHQYEREDPAPHHVIPEPAAPLREMPRALPIPQPEVAAPQGRPLLLHRVVALRQDLICYLGRLNNRVQIRIDGDRIVEAAREAEMSALHLLIQKIATIFKRIVNFLIDKWNQFRGVRREEELHPNLRIFGERLEALRNRCVELVDSYEIHIEELRHQDPPQRPVPARYTQEQMDEMQRPLRDLIERVDRARVEQAIPRDIHYRIELLDIEAMQELLTQLPTTRDQTLDENQQRLAELRAQERQQQEHLAQLPDPADIAHPEQAFQARVARDRAALQLQVTRNRIHHNSEIRRILFSDYV